MGVEEAGVGGWGWRGCVWGWGVGRGGERSKEVILWWGEGWG